MAYQYHTVVSGDTLSDLAVTYSTTVSKLASWNHIENVDLIYIGQRLIVGLGGSNPPPTPKPTTSNTVTIEHFGIQSGTDRTFFITWLWSKPHTKEYKVQWNYQTGDGVSFIGSETTATHKQSLYTAPSNATSITVYVKPVSTTYKSNNKDVTYWTGEWSTRKVYYFSDSPPTAPSNLQATLQNGLYTLDITGLDSTNGTHIEFEIWQDDIKLYKNQTVKIQTGHAAFSASVPDGHNYKARARAVKNSKKSAWTNWTAITNTRPKPPASITKCLAVAPSEVYLEWEQVSGATGYEIEYATEKRYFDGSDSTTTVTTDVPHFNKTGLDSGKEYYFRVRATNNNGSSSWTDLVSITIGEDPIAPTTWSSTSTAVVGDSVALNWTHNSKDGSRLTKSKLSLMIGSRSTEIEIVNDDPLTDSGSFNILNIKEPGPAIVSYLLIRSGPGTEYEEVGRIHPGDIVVTTGPKVSGTNFVPVVCNGVVGWASAYGNNLVDALSQDTKLRWRVQTKGITDNYGDWSVVRTVTVYARPTNSVQIVDSSMNPISDITSFPFYLYCQAGPASQTPIGYHVTVVSNTSYEIQDNIGITEHVYSGDTIYEKTFDISDDLILEFMPGNIALANNATYTFYCVTYMNSGLNAEDSQTLTVSWDNVTFAPNAEIGINMDDISAVIRPFCDDLDGNEVRDVLLSVYRKEFDGDFTEIIKDLDISKAKVTYGTDKTITALRLRSDPDWEASTVTSVPIGHEIALSGAPVINVKTVFNNVNVREQPGGTGTILETISTSGESLELVGEVDGDYTKIMHNDIIGWVYSRYISWEPFYPATVIKNGVTYTGWAWGRYLTSSNVYVTDPHPALDYARYRIVAKSKTTGVVNYYDVPSIPVSQPGIVIQWNDTQTSYTDTNEDRFEEQPNIGSILKLLYNVDWQENTDPESELVEYIGRKNPVSYYGTQTRQKASFNTDIPYDDHETLYTLRKLSKWFGDVYIRESSGIGYWAKITVSMGYTHKEVIVPVSIEVTRVEGGV